MNNQDRYKLTEEDKAILTRPSKWQEMLDRLDPTPDPQYAWRKVTKVKRAKK